NPRQHGEAQSKKSGGEKTETQRTQGATGGWRETVEGRRDVNCYPAGARGAGNAVGGGIARAGRSLKERRGLPDVQPSSVHRYARRAAAARSVDEPRSAHRAYAYTAFLALERPQGRAARFPRRHLLDTGCLSRTSWSAFWCSEVIARAGADLQVSRVVMNNTHFDFVIAGSIGSRWGVADVVL